MSRIGKMPITVPAGVTVTIEDNHVTVRGPKGELARQTNKNMKLTMDNGVITVERPDDEKENLCRLQGHPYADAAVLLPPHSLYHRLFVQRFPLAHEVRRLLPALV